MAERQTHEKRKPFVLPEYCKGCGRCIDACPKHCIEPGHDVNPATGLIPIEMHLEQCNACGLCVVACPEPWGLMGVPEGFEPGMQEAGFELQDPQKLFGSWTEERPPVADIPAELIPLPKTEPLVLKGNYASAVGAILAGCRHVFGYPITPSTEGAELMAKLQPKLDGVFLQAISEVATVNMMYGCGGAGLPCMTFTSSPGFSLMLEGISYLIGAEVPAVFVDVMRGGPGLGNIAPEQSDIKLACHGLGHGNTRAISLAPSTPQEMLDLTILSFELAFKYRNPVIILADGYLGQMTGKVQLPKTMVKPGIPSWAVYGDAAHRGNLINSIILNEADLEKHNQYLNAKYDRIKANEQRSNLYRCDDAEIILVACNTPAHMAKGAVRTLREKGLKVGLFRPLTIWPFPIDALKPLLGKAKRIVVVEASPGQLADEIRLAMAHAGIRNYPELELVARYGGLLPGEEEIVRGVLGAGKEVNA
jgi:pyruvate/2-oxoacid:ferredoxin oxidoreductase alpha subunit/NAD-dependent dihydropyrimidine dehydrogenase PreA subunit